MTKNEKDLLVAQTKLEVYTDVEKRLDGILNGDIDMLEEFVNDVWSEKRKLEDDIYLIEIHVEEEDSEDEPSDFVKNLILNLEEWEELSPSESAIIKSIIEVEQMEPVSVANSLHVSEARYVIDGHLFRLIGPISGDTDDTVEKLKTK